MKIRSVTPEDADAVTAIYAPIVRETVVSFELDPPTVDEMRRRIVATVGRMPWLVGLDDLGAVCGYVYAGKHRERAAYQWSVDVTAYVREDCRGRGIGKRLYGELLGQLTDLGYCQAFAGIALPNPSSVSLHEAVGFTPIGIYRSVGFKHGSWHDVGWWQKPLQAPEHPTAPRTPS